MFRAISVSVLVSLVLSGVAIAETPYAPIFSKDSTSEKKVQYLINGAELRMPPASKAPVEAYPGAKAYSVFEIPSASDSYFQDNRIVFLATTDDFNTVKAHFEKKLSGWKTNTLKNGKVNFLKAGDQAWWGGNKPLEGPRVELTDLTNQAQLETAINEKQLAEGMPSQKTSIKVSFELSRSPLMKVDIEKVTAGCIEEEVKIKAKVMKGELNAGASQYLRNVAEQTCNKNVRKRCEKEMNGRFCQKAARKYRG